LHPRAVSLSCVGAGGHVKSDAFNPLRMPGWRRAYALGQSHSRGHRWWPRPL